MTTSKSTASLIKIVILILGIAALLIGQGWASIVHWLRIRRSMFDSVSEI